MKRFNDIRRANQLALLCAGIALFLSLITFFFVVMPTYSTVNNALADEKKTGSADQRIKELETIGYFLNGATIVSAVVAVGAVVYGKRTRPKHAKRAR
jgi:hypothetical protein